MASNERVICTVHGDAAVIPLWVIILAINEFKKLKQQESFTAKLHDIYGSDNPTALNASKRYHRLEQAIIILEGEKSGKPISARTDFSPQDK